jgi:hypothetical protein
MALSWLMELLLLQVGRYRIQVYVEEVWEDAAGVAFQNLTGTVNSIAEPFTT